MRGRLALSAPQSPPDRRFGAPDLVHAERVDDRQVDGAGDGDRGPDAEDLPHQRRPTTLSTPAQTSQATPASTALATVIFTAAASVRAASIPPSSRRSRIAWAIAIATEPAAVPMTMPATPKGL